MTSRISQDSRKPPDFYQSHIKFLVIDEIRENGFIEDLLSECHNNLVGLAFWPITHNRKMWGSLLLSVPFPSLRKLSISSGSFPSDSECIFRTSIFRNLTHLEIKFSISRSAFAAQILGAQDALSPRKHLSWEGLQALEYLNHLHVDTTLALSDGDHDKLQTIVSDILPHLPPRPIHVSICLLSGLLKQAAQLQNHQRQSYDDLIFGRIDPRIVICYVPAKDKKFSQEVLLKNNFSECILPRRPDDKMFNVGSANDFWEEVENIVHRRNKGL